MEILAILIPVSLLLGGVGGVRAHAADKDCLLRAGFVFASPLRATIPLPFFLTVFLTVGVAVAAAS